jgi:hypothetical protein
MLEKLFITQPSVKIGADSNPFAMTGLRNFPEQVILQRRVPATKTGIVISISLIATRMPGEKVHPAGFEIVRELLNLEILPDIRNQRTGMKIVKQGVFDFFFNVFPRKMFNS